MVLPFPVIDTCAFATGSDEPLSFKLNVLYMLTSHGNESVKKLFTTIFDPAPEESISTTLRQFVNKTIASNITMLFKKLYIVLSIRFEINEH
jgi:hypothetical protein